MPSSKKSPGLAVFLSLIPGLGHCYAGKVEKGTGLFVLSGLLWILMVIAPGVQFASFVGGPGAFPGLVMLTAPLFVFVAGPALVIYSMADSYRMVVAGNRTLEAWPSGVAGADPGFVAEQVGLAAGAPGLAAAEVGHAAGEAAPAPGSTAWTINSREALLWGVILAGLGLLQVVRAAFPALLSSAGRLWPLLLVGAGVLLVWRTASSSGREER